MNSYKEIQKEKYLTKKSYVFYLVIFYNYQKNLFSKENYIAFMNQIRYVLAKESS